MSCLRFASTRRSAGGDFIVSPAAPATPDRERGVGAGGENQLRPVIRAGNLASVTRAAARRRRSSREEGRRMKVSSAMHAARTLLKELHPCPIRHTPAAASGVLTTKKHYLPGETRGGG